MQRFFRTIFFTASILFGHLSNAQILDSLNELLTQKPSFFLKFDNRNSFISSRNINMMGVRAGLVFDNRLMLGLGYSQLNKRIDRTVEVNGNNVLAQFNLRYISFYGEYVFFRNERWEHSIPLLMGYGGAWYRTEFTKENLPRDNGFIYEPAMTTTFKIFPWFGAGIGVGYRLVLMNQSNINENLTSPLYLFKINFYPDPFVDLFKKWRDKSD